MKNLEEKFDKFISNDFAHLTKDVQTIKTEQVKTNGKISFIQGELIIGAPLLLLILGVIITLVAMR